MSNGQNPYGPYAPPGQGAPVHGQAPGQQQPPYGPPPGYGAPPQQPPPPPQPVWDGRQWVYPQQQQAPYQAPPQAAPSYPSGPPPSVHPGMQNPWEQVDPSVRQAMDDEVADLKSRRGEGKVDWYKFKQPANVGDSTESVIRILPAWPGKITGGFWHRTYTHYIWAELEGLRVRLSIACARELSKTANPTQAPLPCAVCERRDAAEQAGDKKAADGLDAKPRFFVNALDCEDLNRHWKQNPQTGLMEPVSCVAQLGPGLFRKISTICHQRGDITSMTHGRLVKIFTTKVGKEQRDVRYDAIDASDPIPVPQGFEQVKLLDLSTLEPIKDYNEVMKLLGGPPPQRSYSAAGAPPAGYGYQAPPPQPYQPPPQSAPPPQQQADQPPPAQQPPPPPQPVWDGQRWVLPGRPPAPQQAQQAPPQQAAQQPPPQQPPPQQQAYQPPPQASSEPPPAGKVQWTGTLCSVCGQPQFMTPGGFCCQNGHGGADPAAQAAPPVAQGAPPADQAVPPVGGAGGDPPF